MHFFLLLLCEKSWWVVAKKYFTGKKTKTVQKRSRMEMLRSSFYRKISFYLDCVHTFLCKNYVYKQEVSVCAMWKILWGSLLEPDAVKRALIRVKLQGHWNANSSIFSWIVDYDRNFVCSVRSAVQVVIAGFEFELLFYSNRRKTLREDAIQKRSQRQYVLTTTKSTVAIRMSTRITWKRSHVYIQKDSKVSFPLRTTSFFFMRW